MNRIIKFSNYPFTLFRRMFCIKRKFPRACEDNNIELVKFYIEYGAKDFNYGLMRACMNKNCNIELVKLLLEHGANINYGFRSACGSGSLDLVNYLIANGAFNYGEGLNEACYYNNVEIAKVIISRINDTADHIVDYNMALYKACQSGNITLMKMMITAGANNFNYAFVVACYRDNLEPVKLLLNYKIHPHSLNEGLRYASIYGNLNLVKYLLSLNEYSNIIYSTSLVRDIIKYTGPRPDLYFEIAKIFMHLGGDICNNKDPKKYLNRLSRVISCKHHLWKIKSVLNDDLMNVLLKTF